jgi:Flp pilus assembly CpaE family ATPase
VPLEALLPQTATQIIELARDEFDYVVIDLPMAITQWLEPVIGAVDELLLVTQLNVPAIRRTRVDRLLHPE